MCFLGGLVLHDWTTFHVSSQNSTSHIKSIGIAPNRVCFFVEENENTTSLSMVENDVLEQEPLTTTYLPVLSNIEPFGVCYSQLIALESYYSSSHTSEREMWNSVSLSPQSVCWPHTRPGIQANPIFGSRSSSHRPCRTLHSLCYHTGVVAFVATGVQCILIFINSCFEARISRKCQSYWSYAAKLAGVFATLGAIASVLFWMYYSYGFVSPRHSMDRSRTTTWSFIKTYGSGIHYMWAGIALMLVALRNTFQVADFQHRLVLNEDVWKEKKPLDCPPCYVV